MTMRELAWAAEGKSRAEWEHTAALMAHIANVNRDPKRTRPYQPQDFSPYTARREAKRGVPLTRENIGLLKLVIVDRKGSAA